MPQQFKMAISNYEFNLAEAEAKWSGHTIFDLAANMADSRYEGIYADFKLHEADLDQVF